MISFTVITLFSDGLPNNFKQKHDPNFSSEPEQEFDTIPIVQWQFDKH